MSDNGKRTTRSAGRNKSVAKAQTLGKSSSASSSLPAASSSASAKGKGKTTPSLPLTLDSRPPRRVFSNKANKPRSHLGIENDIIDISSDCASDDGEIEILGMNIGPSKGQATAASVCVLKIDQLLSLSIFCAYHKPWSTYRTSCFV